VRRVSFTVLGQPQPQGSIRAFMVGGKPRLTSANAKMKPWRQQVGWDALRVREGDGPFAPHHVPVRAVYEFTLTPPAKMPKGRVWPAVKPDIDKLCRAVNDALTGILWVDDGQVCEMIATKKYGSPAKTDITVEIL
jgi:Holliday junction resolvase RusA-like endonuclease